MYANGMLHARRVQMHAPPPNIWIVTLMVQLPAAYRSIVSNFTLITKNKF